MDQTDYAKSKTGKHRVPDRVWKRIPEILSDPVFAFEYSHRVGFLTKDIDADGKPLVIGIQKNAKVFHEIVNRIKTAFGLDDPAAWISRALEAGATVRVYDIEQTDAFLRSFGYKAEEAGSIRSGDTLTLQKIDVNTETQLSVRDNGLSDRDLLLNANETTMTDAQQKSVTNYKRLVENYREREKAIPRLLFISVFVSIFLLKKERALFVLFAAYTPKNSRNRRVCSS